MLSMRVSYIKAEVALVQMVGKGMFMLHCNICIFSKSQTDGSVYRLHETLLRHNPVLWEAGLTLQMHSFTLDSKSKILIIIEFSLVVCLIF
jgi:hypothetical protein